MADSIAPRFSQRSGLGVDGQRRLVAEQVARHRREHERQLRMHHRNLDGLHRGGEALFSFGGDDDRRRLVGAEDRHLFGDVVGRRAGEAGGAHEDQGLRRQVDVLLVLGGVAGDRLVTELGELDPQLVGRDPVRAVADDRPIAPRRRPLLSDGTDLRAAGQHLFHRVGQRAQRGQQLAVDRSAHDLGDRRRQQEARRELRVQRLRRRHRHLDVATVGRVEHAVRLVDQVAVASVDDGDHAGAASAREVDGAVGVGGGARLADGDDERVVHLRPQTETGELGGEGGLDSQFGVARHRAQRGHEALAGDVSGALPDRDHAADGARREIATNLFGQRFRSERQLGLPVDLDQLAAQRLAERGRRLADLLQQEVRERTPVDVASRDLRDGDVVVGDRESRCRRRRSGGCLRAIPAWSPSSTRTWPRLAFGLSRFAGVSPSMRM